MGLKLYIKRGLQYIFSGIPEKIVKPNISYLAPNARLLDKKIVITGGGRGLGYAMAKKFSSEGATVLISGRNEDKLKEVSQELGCKWLLLDVQKDETFQEFINKASELLGGIDCFINNAGISLHEGNIRNVSSDQFDAQLLTNLKGPYFLAQKFVEFCEKSSNNKAQILFVSSERGSYVDDLPYGLTKAAINSFVQGLSNRVIGSGIRVNAIAPGVTASDMTGFDPDGNLYCPYNITERVYLPEEVAEVACFLLSDASACLSGQIILCNEGKSINSHWR